jgi:hypothetical protein
MAIMINDSSRYAAAAASRAFSLAIHAEVLADEIDALHRDICAARDEPVRQAGFRCDTASDWMRQADSVLHATVGHLDCIAAAMKPGACAVPWGVCPGHGNTLTREHGRGLDGRVTPDRKAWPKCPAPSMAWRGVLQVST